MVVVVGVATMLFESAGPMFLGTRPLPPRMRRASSICFAPVMLHGAGRHPDFRRRGESISVDARVPGVAAGAIAVWRGVHRSFPAMVIAAVVTAVARQLGA